MNKVVSLWDTLFYSSHKITSKVGNQVAHANGPVKSNSRSPGVPGGGLSNRSSCRPFSINHVIAPAGRQSGQVLTLSTCPLPSNSVSRHPQGLRSNENSQLPDIDQRVRSSREISVLTNRNQ